VSTSRFLAVLCFSAALYAQMPQPDVASLIPNSGVVSLRELQHPVPKKAARAAYQAQQFSTAHKSTQAIAKLEEAIRIDPSYRDAHCNLGVE